ncbi:MAG: tetratricopeptide repeat protein [Bryobacteraceae bacterium]
MSPTDIAHAAITDHRILRKPSESSGNSGIGPQTLKAWTAPPEQFRARDLGLAELEFGSRIQQESMTEDAARLLNGLPRDQKDEDPAVLSARAATLLSQGNTEEALLLCRRVVEKRPSSAQYAVYLGMALNRKGDLAGAARELSRAIDLDPSLQDAYVQLVDIYGRQGLTTKVQETIDRYLRWNPQNIWFRLAKLEAPQPATR